MSKIMDLRSKIGDNANKNVDNIKRKIYDKLPVPLWTKRIIINFIEWVWYTILPVVVIFTLLGILLSIVSVVWLVIQPYISIYIPKYFGIYLISIFILLTGFYILKSFATTKIHGIEEDIISPSAEVSLEQRITRLAESLKDSTKSLNEISQEIESRKELATKLQVEIEAAKLKTPEINAVTQILRNELIKERKNAFWQNMAVKFIFYILGVISSMAINMYVLK